ncbi:kelch repeat-containing protein [Flammeovirga sp. OC4]|uniref:Kelch repeat-containing protein n=1 Tax=Flammeovirga sp. OC4 TaxID=1382345 RepID=UPI0009E3B1FF|nr:kelch repeat-containing protein [Flammeovirga sp. OC4]
MKLLSSSIYGYCLLTLSVIIQSCVSANISKEFENATLRFSKGTPMPSPRAYMGYCNTPKTTFVVGGMNKAEEHYNTILSYSPKNDSWNEVTPINIKGEKLINTTISSGSMFLFNGTKGNEDDPMASIDVNVREVAYNNRVPEIMNVSLNPQAIHKSSIAEWKGRVFLFGGKIDNDTYSNTLFSFDSKKKEWKQLAHMPKQMITYGAVSNGKLYVFGGKNEAPIDEIYMYNIKVDRWVKVGKLAEPIVDATITSYGSNIVIFSNEQLFIYNTDKGTLKRYHTNIGKLVGNGMTISADKLIIFGGVKTNSVGKDVYSSTVYTLDVQKILQ